MQKIENNSQRQKVKTDLELYTLKTSFKKEQKKHNIALIKIDNLKNELSNKNEIISKLNHNINFLKTKNNQFRHSIVFPIFKLTNKIGKTTIGNILQKLLK